MARLVSRRAGAKPRSLPSVQLDSDFAARSWVAGTGVTSTEQTQLEACSRQGSQEAGTQRPGADVPALFSRKYGGDSKTTARLGRTLAPPAPSLSPLARIAHQVTLGGRLTSLGLSFPVCALGSAVIARRVSQRPQGGMWAPDTREAPGHPFSARPQRAQTFESNALRLVNQEIEKFQKGEGKDEEKYIDVVINKNMKLGQKVLIPVKQFPKFNFVGKLLGPRGNSLKRLQEETLTKMSILGKGSMRDKAKEEELRKSGEAKYFHLNDDLHVLIEVFAPPAEAYARMGHALEEIKKFLIPDYNDEIRQAQLQELTYLNGGSENADVPVVRGKSTLRTRGVPTPPVTRGRGGVTARPVAVGVPRGTPAPRGVLSTRGPVSRGRGLLTPRARGAPPTGYRPPPPPPTQETYGEYDYDDGYGTAYDDQSYDSYDNSYSTPAQSGADYYDYGHGLSEETYDSYGQEEWTNSRHKAPSARTAKGVYRDQPYGRY
ncbi:KH domain-containing, RNA-binding, signal transduction-associated protein 3 [Tupaia chinensis]|uniref:KH domain-containing, RNA-binding, signal transduction-associated protein 3 n=1 Tax=Tupaia chinensis TaxID=246437 RepID=UPI000FFC2DDE|nr:KH domain-containing, RNA-binding, signal transduction-associated protein 3 [Tupaia chinensis]